ncbi:MAG: O-methyltransferase [Pseudoflavonifractor sp.]|nr:O-methyltransferase [Alloprevotella sp.]MCM1116932.1 O-methyltransferase [Pseudoflavonifractor sp.]
MTDALEEYILQNISPEPKALYEIWRHTNLHHLYPRMCSGHLQGRLLKLLTEMAAPKRIIELGAFTGYSTLSIAEGMPAGARLHTIEADDEMEEELRRRLEASSRGADITLHIGDALEMIEPLSRQAGPWDMAYIDANKREYRQYVEQLMPHMSTGATLVCDNTLWGGKVTDPEAHDTQTEAIRSFNTWIATHPRVKTCVIIPLRDGLTLVTLK